MMHAAVAGGGTWFLLRLAGMRRAAELYLAETAALSRTAGTADATRAIENFTARNMWNVGDGVKEYANGGTTACAETAQMVAARYPLVSGSRPG